MAATNYHHTLLLTHDELSELIDHAVCTALERYHATLDRDQPNAPARLMTIAEAASYLQVHRSTIYRYISQGMPCEMLPGGARRFDLTRINRWIANADLQTLQGPSN